MNSIIKSIELSVDNSVWNSVGLNTWDSVWDSNSNSIWRSVRGSTRDFVHSSGWAVKVCTNRKLLEYELSK